MAGTAALIDEIDPTLSPKDVLSILRAAGVDNTDGDQEFGIVTHLGFPRLDVESAIDLAWRGSPLSAESPSRSARLATATTSRSIRRAC